MPKQNHQVSAHVYVGLKEGRRNAVKRRADQTRNIPNVALNSCSDSFGVTSEEIISRTREQNVVFARHAFCLMVRKFTRLPLREIGELIGGRDHATVLHSVKTAENLIEYDDQFKQMYDEALSLLTDECNLLAYITNRREY
tara:strand:+ start:77 stop:499 length:423 start_codon:yes stop_codon:yes gene_type:complete